MDNKKLLMALIIIVVIEIAGISAFLVFNNDHIEYTNATLDGFTMEVPVGSTLTKLNSADYGFEDYNGPDGYVKLLAYKNRGNYSNELNGIIIVDSSISVNMTEIFSSDTESSSNDAVPLFESIFDVGEGVGDGAIYVNESDIKIIGGNTTSGEYYIALKAINLKGDNTTGFAVIGGEDLDIVSNATYSLKKINS